MHSEPGHCAEDCTLHYSKTVGGTPAVSLLVKGWSELIDHGWVTDGETLIGWDHEVLWLAYGERPVAAISFRMNDWNKTCNIGIAYVVPEFRRLGLYHRLFERLREQAQGAGMRCISGTTHAQNQAMQFAAKSVGRQLKWLTFEIDVPQT